MYFISLGINIHLIMFIPLGIWTKKKLTVNVESYFISLFKNKHIGDDGAYIDGYVYSKDAFFENIHFANSIIY